MRISKKFQVTEGGKMPDNRNWQTELDEYLKLGEPTKVERSDAWKAAIGLQDVDGLKTSEYLLDTAKEHIEGKINIADAQARIQSYYEQGDSRRRPVVPVNRHIDVLLGAQFVGDGDIDGLVADDAQ